MGSITNSFSSQHYFKLEAQGGYLEVPQAGQEATSTNNKMSEKHV